MTNSMDNTILIIRKKAFSLFEIDEDSYILLYNLAFTSLPIIFLGAFDQDVSSKVSMKVPQLYMRGILRKDWSSTKFWFFSRTHSCA